MAYDCDQKGMFSSEPCGNRMKSLLSVEFLILESVEDVESGKVEGESDGP